MYMILLLLSLSLTSYGFSDEGPGVCPNGRMHAYSDVGSGIDPDGARVTTSGDQGAGIDPNG